MKDEISVESANNCVDNLIAEIHRLQEPKTPTQEQIDYIRKQMDLLSTPLEDIPVIAIEIWENIRNVDARVEKMCKNNLGTKDWLDFYNAINSQK